MPYRRAQPALAGCSPPLGWRRCPAAPGTAGGQDRLADPIDVEYLLEAVAPGTVVLQHCEPHYQHLDYDWGRDAHERIYPLVLQLLERYSGGAAAGGG
jgi:hypothetical protein